MPPRRVSALDGMGRRAAGPRCGSDFSQTLFQRSLGLDQFLGQVVGQLLEVGIVQLELFCPGGFVDAGDALELDRKSVV